MLFRSESTRDISLADNRRGLNVPIINPVVELAIFQFFSLWWIIARIIKKLKQIDTQHQEHNDEQPAVERGRAALWRLTVWP